MNNEDMKSRLRARRAADGVAPDAGFNDDATFTERLRDELTAPNRETAEAIDGITVNVHVDGGAAPDPEELGTTIAAAVRNELGGSPPKEERMSETTKTFEMTAEDRGRAVEAIGMLKTAMRVGERADPVRRAEELCHAVRAQAVSVVALNVMIDTDDGTELYEVTIKKRSLEGERT